MAGVEEELWNIFTFYTLHGNSLDLTMLSVTQFLRFARDCQIIGDRPTAPSRGDGKKTAKRRPRTRKYSPPGRKLDQAVLHLTFTTVIQQRPQRPASRVPEIKCGMSRPRTTGDGAAAGKSRLTYLEFLNALVLLAERIYKHNAGACASRRMVTPARGGAGPSACAADARPRGCSAEDCFRQLLMENVLPFASRRRPRSLGVIMQDPLILDVLQYFGPALKEIFRFYAASSSSVKRNPILAKSRNSRSSCGATAGCRRAHSEASTSHQMFFRPPMSNYENSSVVIDPPTRSLNSKSNEETIQRVVFPSQSNGDNISAVPTNGTSVGSSPPEPPLLASNSVGSSPSCPCHHPPSSEEGKQSGSTGETRSRLSATLRSGTCDDDECKARGRSVSARSSPAVVNSMVDSLSHVSLLNFAADFGISGALLSTLDIGDVFLSCEADEICHQTDRLPRRGDGETSGLGGFAESTWSQTPTRTEMARAGEGDIRPLSYAGFQEALVRFSVACFHSRGISSSNRAAHGDDFEQQQEQENDRTKKEGAAECLRAMMAYMWRRLHKSVVELALNGVREGGSRYRSCIQKGVLLRGVQLFNERMLSRWREESYLDLATTSPLSPIRPVPSSSSTNLRSTRVMNATAMLQRMLTVENDDSPPAHDT